MMTYIHKVLLKMYFEMRRLPVTVLKMREVFIDQIIEDVSSPNGCMLHYVLNRHVFDKIEINAFKRTGLT